jgi:Ca2+-binding RTX toxin-like protein
MADAGIAIWYWKYKYDFWRPISGIREAAKDGNPATTADPTWVPLGAPGNGTTIPDFTPPFPAYGSGHAGFGAAMFKVLEHFYGTDNVSYTLHSDEGGGLVRNFTSFSQAADENGRSRIYLGVHWEFDNVNSQAQGRQIADFVYDRLFLPVTPTDTLLSVRKNAGGMQTYTLPADADVLIRRVGTNLQIVNQLDSSVIYSAPFTQIEQIAFNGGDGSANNVIVEMNPGPMNVPFTIDIEGTATDGDSLTVNGTGKGDLLKLDDNLLTLGAVGPYIYLTDVEVVTLNGKFGNDSLQVLGDQTDRTINLHGDSGNDTFKIGSTDGTVNVTETFGTDLLDFSHAGAGVEINLALNAGQVQSNTGVSDVQLTGQFESLDGSDFDDRLYGNALANRIRGGGGNDIVRGEAGNDIVEGNEGDDVVLGGLGSDKLYGSLGRDLLIGGSQTDLLYGATGDDILIGGNTTHDGSEAALLAIMAEWTSANSNIDRINNLKNGTGVAPKNNGTTYLDNATVLNDGAIDSLFANTGDFVLKFNPDLQLKG